MHGNNKGTVRYLGDEPDDDLPDVSSDEWVQKFKAAPLQRGRPRMANPKVSTTIRLDPDVLEAFKAGGPGWQSRINAALRKAAGLS
jgi:uncharacterized protein (DUF4415 family)